MKKNIISGGAAIIFGLLIALGPQFLFKVCASPEGLFLKCHWAARAEFCTGLLIAALGVFMVIFSDYKVQLGLTIGLFLTGLFSVVIPHELFIGLCKDADAPCRKVTNLVLTILCVIVIVGAVINMIYLEKKTKK